MDMKLTITELSTLTGKTRPTLYKYIRAYEANNYDVVPFSFIRLFELMDEPNSLRKDIVGYCKANFSSPDSDIKVNEIISLIQGNKDKIDLDRLRKTIEEEINNG